MAKRIFGSEGNFPRVRITNVRNIIGSMRSKVLIRLTCGIIVSVSILS
jgi:hypothetical protein